MRVNLNGVVTGRRVWRKIELRDGQGFEIELRGPTFDEQIRDTALEGVDAWDSRINTNLVGWRGVEGEDGAPVPFRRDRFEALCELVPTVFQQTLRHLADLYYGLGEDEQKNSVTPPASGSAGGADYEAGNATGSPS